MKNITKEELSIILKQHKLWLEDGSKGKKADLSYSNLSFTSLRDANLSGAN